jgi:hypothetical protein
MKMNMKKTIIWLSGFLTDLNIVKRKTEWKADVSINNIDKKYTTHNSHFDIAGI